MQWLIAAVASLFSGLITWLAQVGVRRLLILAAVTALAVTLISTFHSTLSGLLSSVQAGMYVPPAVAEGIRWLPSNTATCLSIMVTAEFALWTFRVSRRFAEYRLGSV